MKIKWQMIIGFSCLTLFSSSLQGQESLKIRDILSCFPAGTYSSLQHHDTASLAAADIYPFYKKYLEGASSKNKLYRGPLPELIRYQETSYTKARLEIYKTSKRLQTENGKPDWGKSYQKLQSENREMGSVNFITEKNKEGQTLIVTQYSLSEILWVFRYQDLPGMLKKAEKEGLLEKTGTVLFDKPVYKLNGYDKQRNPVSYSAFATDINELLLAPNEELLLRMINCANGLEANILEEPGYTDLPDFSPFLAQRWDITFFSPQRDRLIDRLNKTNEDSKDLAKTVKTFEAMPSSTINTYQLGDSIIHKTILVFSDAAKARAHFEYRDGINWASETPPKPVRKYYSLINKRTKRKLEDRFIISSYEYDEELALEEQKKNKLVEKYLSKKDSSKTSASGPMTITSLEKGK